MEKKNSEIKKSNQNLPHANLTSIITTSSWRVGELVAEKHLKIMEQEIESEIKTTNIIKKER